MNLKILFVLFASLILTSCTSKLYQDLYPDRPLLQTIAQEGDLQKVQDAVSKGASVNEIEAKYGTSALQFAQYNIYKANNHPTERRDVVTYLIEKGANPNHIDYMGRMAFAEIMKDSQHPEDNYKDEEKVKIARLMLSKGFEVKLRESRSGNTPLHYLVNNAIQNDKYSEVITVLLRAGADPNFKNVKGETPKGIIEEKANEDLKKSFLKNLITKKSR